MNHAFAAALLRPDAPTPPGLTTWNGSDPARRFAVYRNNVVVSLIEALAGAFPVTCELVGEEFFRAMARAFALDHPPRSPVMARYGEEFPRFIAGFEPAFELPWLADVAALEAARIAAYHAADAEPVTTQAFAALDPATLPTLRLMLHPSLRLIRSRCAVVSIWAAHQGQGDLAEVDPDVAEDALIVRPGLDVETILAPPGAAAMLAGFLSGQALGEALEAGLAEAADFDMTGALALLVRSGAAIGFSHDQKEGDAR